MIRVLVLTVLLLLAGAPATAQSTQKNQTIRLDSDLYKVAATETWRQGSYYPAIAALHRQEGYPLKPFFAVRPPTLTWLGAALGPIGLLIAGCLLTGLALLMWFRRLADSSLYVRAGFLGIHALSSAALILPNSIWFTEAWAGMLLSMALACKDWRARLGLVLGAVLFRELAALFLVVLAAEALWRKAWRELAAIGLAGLVFAIGLYLHARAVWAVVIPGDLPSQGWLAQRGLPGLLGDVAEVSFMRGWPLVLVAAVLGLALAGWVRRGMVPALWFGGFCFFIAVAARVDNFYWAQMMLPALLAGAVFAPGWWLGGSKAKRKSRPLAGGKKV